MCIILSSSPVASSETTALQAAAYPTIPYPGVGQTFTFLTLTPSLKHLFRLLDQRPRGLQPVHLPPAPGVWRRRAHADVPPLWQRHQLEGVHRPGDQPEQVLRVCQLRQPHKCPGRHPGDERVPDRDEATEGSAETAKRRVQAVLGAG